MNLLEREAFSLKQPFNFGNHTGDKTHLRRAGDKRLHQQHCQQVVLEQELSLK